VSRPIAHHVDAALTPDPARVVARLYLPGEEQPMGRSRTSAVVARVLDLAEDKVEEMATQLVADFSHRHLDYTATLAEYALIVSSNLAQVPVMSAARTLVLGASFTAEYAVEAAALCNPSAVEHPDQTGLGEGQVRVAVSLRAIGEGHVSSLGFASAIVGPGTRWQFEARRSPSVAGTASAYSWRRAQLRAVLTDHGSVDELTRGVLGALPAVFTELQVHQVLTETHAELLARPGSLTSLDTLRRVMASAYEVTFPPEVELSQQVLLPATPDERNGIEDARFVRFTDPAGTVDYRATYTAYDGNRIAPRLLTSPDLRNFRAHVLAGPAARNKGMALFPRLIHGKYWSLCRSDGESTSVSKSSDGFGWGQPSVVQAPHAPWEMLQIGNCGSPIETEQGWLVLTHGVGPMRTYAIGAILLDLDDPTQLRGRLREPLLQATAAERDGYVPNVVYSCGGVVHDGRLWLPYGISDSRIGVAWASVEELLAAMTPVGSSSPTTLR
jgi:predicted GH43/DUF377 family glycosyl hydrolase